MIKGKIAQRKADILLREKREQESADWDKRLTKISAQLTFLKDEAYRLELANAEVKYKLHNVH